MSIRRGLILVAKSSSLLTISHMDGLKRPVELRGGLQCLGPGSMIEHKARR